MAADQLRRKQKLCPPVDRLAFERVVAVTAPHAVGTGQDTEVHATAAGGTRLDLQPGVPAPQLVDQLVDGERVPVHDRFTATLMSAVDEVAVVVPLEIVDV